MFKYFSAVFLATLAAILVLAYSNKSGGEVYEEEYVMSWDYKHKAKGNLEDIAREFGEIKHKGRHTLTIRKKSGVKIKDIPGLIVEPLKIYKASFITGCAEKPTPPTPPPSESPLQKADWGVERVDAVRAMKINDARNIKVCVIDTGISTLHPDIKYIAGENFTTPDLLDIEDRQGHGTHTAGLVAAVNNTFGVVGSSQAQLIIGKVLDDEGSGYNSWIADGIRYCVDSGADIISASLGGPYSSIIKNAVDFALSEGVIVVAAAGNESSSSVGYPAAYEGVYSISATDVNDKLAWFSNYGKIDFACPGVEILSTVPGGYDRMSGTSMATPICAGIIALYKARGIPYKVENIGPSQYFGRGLLSAKGL